MQTAGYKVYSSKAELENARLNEAAQTSYTERFYTLMKLIKVSEMISGAKIISSPKLTD